MTSNKVYSLAGVEKRLTDVCQLQVKIKVYTQERAGFYSKSKKCVCDLYNDLLNM